MVQSAPKPTPASRLGALINAPDILALPGVFDGFSTWLVERMGYTAAFITGSGVSESRLGQPDVGLIGLDENVAAASDVASRANKFAPTTLHGATRAGNSANL
jgi:2-methylisocitrate lyase-like PEP mutase family enzyme